MIDSNQRNSSVKVNTQDVKYLYSELDTCYLIYSIISDEKLQKPSDTINDQSKSDSIASALCTLRK